MDKQHINNRKLPAWIGSILFHGVIFLLLLCWFSSSPDKKSAPGDRSASGTITFSPAADAQQESPVNHLQESPDDETDVAKIVSERLSPIDWESMSMDDTDEVDEDETDNIAGQNDEWSPLLAPGSSSSRNPSSLPASSESASRLTALLQQTVAQSSGAGRNTGEAAIPFFGMQGKGSKFMYVLDRSSSMSGMPFQRAKEELVKSLSALGEFQQFNILFYNGIGIGRIWRTDAGRTLVFATQPEKEDAVRFIETIPAEGGTRHFEPLKEAIAHRPDVIFFLTDGEKPDDLSPAQLSEIERINHRVGSGVQINVIQFGSGGLTDSPSRSLEQLAKDNHGNYQYNNIAAWK